MPIDENEKPHLRLAVDNDETEIVRERAKQSIRWPLRELAANIIRVTRGAGKPYEIAEQCVDVVHSFQRYREACGTWPSSGEVQEALSIHNEHLERMTGEHLEEKLAFEKIIRGVLQASASRLVGQNTQERMGEHEAYTGVNSIGRLREESRQRWAAEQRASRPQPKPRTTTKKKAVKTRKKPAPKAEPDIIL